MEQSLSTIDLSLFAGDLLSGWSPVSKSAASKGSLGGWTDISPAGSPPAYSPAEPLSPVTEHQDVSPFGSNWLDTQVDLLNYLAGPELEGLEHVAGDDPSPLVEQDPTVRAVQVLQSIAEQNDALLADSSSSNLPRVFAGLPEDDGHFLDLFQNSLDGLVDPSSILAPMSPEDVDSILSSGPSSPVSVDAEIAMDSSFDTVNSSVSSDDSDNMITIELSDDVLQLLNPILLQESASPEADYDMVSVSPSKPSIEELVKIHRPKPYERPRKPGSTKGLPKEVIQLERKLRKKQQNKDAATRYRQKKKAESQAVKSEEDLLEDHNKELHEKVDSMTKEIGYLKDLLAEVYQARGLPLPFQKRK